MNSFLFTPLEEALEELPREFPIRQDNVLPEVTQTVAGNTTKDALLRLENRVLNGNNTYQDFPSPFAFITSNNVFTFGLQQGIETKAEM